VPNTCQRSAVRASIYQPWIRLNGGSVETMPHAKATRIIATASRLVTLPIAMSGLSNSLDYFRRTKRPMIGVGPGSARGSTKKTILCDPRLAA
jgi:hypothetical protein